MISPTKKAAIIWYILAATLCVIIGGNLGCYNKKTCKVTIVLPDMFPHKYYKIIHASFNNSLPDPYMVELNSEGDTYMDTSVFTYWHDFKLIGKDGRNIPLASSDNRERDIDMSTAVQCWRLSISDGSYWLFIGTSDEWGMAGLPK